MIKPIYSALKVNHKDIAINIFNKYKNFYHPIAAASIAKELGVTYETEY